MLKWARHIKTINSIRKSIIKRRWQSKKDRYSDKELAQFKKIIDAKLDEAQK